MSATAGEVLLARLTEQVAELHRRDAEVRDGVDDAVHQLRVTCRRLRGALATFRPLVDRQITEPVRAELRWLARALGEGRDAEVAHDRLRALVDALPPSEVVGPVRRRLDRTYAERGRAAEGHAARVQDSVRYRRLLDRLDRLVADPPLGERAGSPADVVLPPLVRSDGDRLRKRVADAREAGTLDDAAWHRARKAAKRLRYAVEVLDPDAVEAVQGLTRTLGERQDTVVTRRDLRRIAREAAAAGESTFTYGVLYESERTTAAGLAERFDEDWRRWVAVAR